MDFWTAVELFGFPAAALVAVAIGAVRVARYLGKKVVEPMTEAGVELFKSTKAANDTNAETLKSIGGVMRAEVGIFDQIKDQNDKILYLAGKNHDILSDLQKQQSEA